MKRIVILLTVMVLGLGLSAPAFAGGNVLSDGEMDDIHAGDWIVITDADGNQYVVDVYYNNNDLQLLNESQTELKAVNNANTVDSAIAVQTNISRATGDEYGSNAAINGTNEANILNYNPSESSSSYSKLSNSSSVEDRSFSMCKFNSSKEYSSEHSFEYAYDETLTWDETLDIVGAAAEVGESRDKGSRSEYAKACVFLLDYDKDIDYNKEESIKCSSSKKCNKTTDMLHLECSNTTTSTESIEESGSESRSNLSENNHLWLEDTSQKLLMAVSNLNAVGSGAAVQTNIASNMGIGGSITHVNSATVVNGL